MNAAWRRLAAGHQVSVPHLLCQLRIRKRIEGATDLAARIAELQTPGEDDIECGAGYHAEMAECRDGAGKAPARYGHAHAALYELRQKPLPH